VVGACVRDSMHQAIQAHISTIPWLDEMKEAAEAFEERLTGGEALFKGEGVTEHLCSFFVPLYQDQVFIGHHIKADMWIPPGGHIEPGEHPVEAVWREFKEELGYELVKEPVALFGLSITEIGHPERGCLEHWDMWHAVLMEEKVPFKADPGEFYEARWMPLNEAFEVIRVRDVYNKTLKLVDNYLGIKL
jgi:8-oxo-dGTP diphosphatase